MTAAFGPAAINADDKTLRLHLEQGAHIPTLLMTVAHLTGDLSLLRDEWRPVLSMSAAESGMTPEQEAAVRAVCFEAIAAFRDSGNPPPPRPSPEQFRKILSWAGGAEILPLLSLVAEELVIDGDDLRVPRWNKAEIAPDRPFHVAIVGAGESGLIAAIRLRQAGVPFVIYEKNPDVGGTWYENAYPGCRVDIHSFLYSYAFYRKTWKDYFSTQEDTLGYLREVARHCGLYEHIKFETEVVETRWDEDRQLWDVTTRHAGALSTASSNVLVFAVGQLNRPMTPNFPGRERFAGPSFHSARWDYNVDLTGKRVGIIGTGASAAQFIPHVARQAASLAIFARTTSWLLPTPELHARVSDSARWLLDHIPRYAIWRRAAYSVVQTPGFLGHVAVDETYPPSERAVSAKNDQLRELVQGWMEPQIADRPDLRDAVIPKAPIGAKRIVRDNGTWIATLKRNNVRVVQEQIEHLDEQGIVCADGAQHPLDVLIYGTGFHAAKFLFPINVIGRGGTDLRALWGEDDARAYLGVTVPGFPNMFCLYGPNTNLVVHGATIILYSELTTKYIVDAVRLLLQDDRAAMDVKPEVFGAYTQGVDQANRKLAWGYSGVSSWYKNSAGRVTQNYPYSAAEFWQRTNAVVPDDYNLS